MQHAIYIHTQEAIIIDAIKSDQYMYNVKLPQIVIICSIHCLLNNANYNDNLIEQNIKNILNTIKYQ